MSGVPLPVEHFPALSAQPEIIHGFTLRVPGIEVSHDKAEALTSHQEVAGRKRELERKRAALERQIAGLRSDHEAQEEELRRLGEQGVTRTRMLTAERTALASLRQADATVTAGARGNTKPKDKKR